jgi:hypothetical protein
MNLYLKYAKEKIKIADKAFASGGEGNLYKIHTAKYSKSVAKLYHPFKLNEQRLKKIEFLYLNPPENTEQGIHKTFIWVEDILFNEANEFVGLIMPFIKGEKLEVLCGPKLPKHLGAKWMRFDHSLSTSRELRLRICFNLAVAIYRIHGTKKYVLVDLKPDNVIVQANGLLSLVDMDSVEVFENGDVKFPAPVSTPEYTPPESYSTDKRNEEEPIDKEWDLFSMSVIMYRILFGIHPFAASSNAPYDHLVTLHDKIREGLFVHNKQKQTQFSVIPPPHKSFTEIGDNLQNLFKKTFVDGHKNPDSRPRSDEWCLELLNAFGDENLKLNFMKVLLSNLGILSRQHLPSKVITFPKIKIEQNDLVENEYITLINWQEPEPNTLNPKSLENNQKRSFRPLVLSLLLFCIITVPIYFLSPSVHQLVYDLLIENLVLSFFLFQLLLLIPFVVMPRILKRYFLSKSDSYYNEQKLKVKNLKSLAENIIFDINYSKNYILNFLNREIKNAEQSIINFSKNRSVEFNKFLLEKDKEFDMLVEEEKIVNQKIISEAFIELLKNPLFTNYQGANNLSDLKQILKNELQEKRSALSQDKNSTNELNSTELNLYFETELNKIELSKKQFLANLNEDFQSLQNQLKNDSASVNYNFHRIGDLAKSHKNYLSKVPGNPRQILLMLQQAGMDNISQIEDIDSVNLTVRLKDSKLISLSNICSVDTLGLASKLELWRLDYLNMKQKHNDAQLKFKKNYESRLEALKKEEAEELAVFDNKIATLKQDIISTLLENKIQRLNAEYQELFDAIKKTELIINQKLEEPANALIEKSHKIVQSCIELLQTEHEEIANFKSKLKTDLNEKLREEGLDTLKNTSLEKLEKLEQSIKETKEFENFFSLMS